MELLDFFDITGTFVFAVAGALRAVRHRLDLLGIMVLAVATGVGGGMIRDVLLGATPPAAISSELYLIVCLLGGAVVMIAASRVATQWNRVMFADAVGLGVFTAIGAAKGLQYELGPIGVVIMGALTATGGGIVRDILVREVPAVLKEDFYATATIIGGAALLLAELLGFGTVVQIWTAVVVTSGLRFFAMFRGMNLPRISPVESP